MMESNAGSWRILGIEDFASIKIGKYTISRCLNQEKIHIRSADGEGGDFLVKDFEEALEEYYRNNF